MTDLGPNQRVVSYNEYDVILYRFVLVSDKNWSNRTSLKSKKTVIYFLQVAGSVVDLDSGDS